MEKTLNLHFTTDNKKTHRISLAHPKEGLTKDVVDPIVEKILETKAFDNKKRKLSSVKKVAYVSREETIIK